MCSSSTSLNADDREKPAESERLVASLCEIVWSQTPGLHLSLLPLLATDPHYRPTLPPPTVARGVDVRYSLGFGCFIVSNTRAHPLNPVSSAHLHKMSAFPTDRCYRSQRSVYRSTVACRARLHPVSVALAQTVRRFSRYARAQAFSKQASPL